MNMDILFFSFRAMNIDSVKTVAQIIRKYFPDAQVFPAVGNHEASRHIF
jgi:hypothetical protein